MPPVLKEKREKKRGGEKAQPIQYSAAREYFITLVVCSLFALFVTTYVVHPMTVPTPSMVPTILVGDRLLVDKFSIRNQLTLGPVGTPRRPLRRGDVIVFKYPESPDQFYVKRLIGLSGEAIEVRSGSVYINGQVIQEPYLPEQASTVRSLFGVDYGPEKIPEDHYFVMGDNRNNSQDSRYFGFLPEVNIVGRPLLVFWSYEDEPGAHNVRGAQLILLYLKRALLFIPRTRWSRFGHFIH